MDKQEYGNTREALPKSMNSRTGGFFIYCIVGQKGSGKSTVLLNLLNTYFKKYYDNIYYVSTTGQKDPKFKALIDELDEDGKYYNNFTEDVMSQIMEQLEQNIEDGEFRNLVIFDDCVAKFPLATDKSSVFNSYIIGSRHYKADIIITSQKFNKLNSIIRCNTDIFSIFPSNNKYERQCMIKELNVDEDRLIKYIDEISDDKHNFLTISFISNKSAKPKYYKIFDEIIE